MCAIGTPPAGLPLACKRFRAGIRPLGTAILKETTITQGQMVVASESLMNYLVRGSLPLLALLSLAALPLRAEVLLLKTGGRIEGELLNPGRTASEAYHLRTPRESLSLLPRIR